MSEVPPPRPVSVPDAAAGRPESSEDLLLRVARGDEDAFSQLYDRVAPTVWGVARRVLRDSALAEDVTQEQTGNAIMLKHCSKRQWE